MRSDTVIESLADKYGVSRSEILDTGEGGGELAVRLAMGETHVLQENRDFFLSHGVNLSALESASSGSRAASRSTTTLLIKNLPHDLIPEEIEDMFARYGALSSFLVPPSKTLALIDFVEPSEARAAFRGLSYRKYKHVPLYLEWAPQGIISATAASKKSSEQEKEAMKPKLRVDVKDLVESDENFSSLFIKNLNFTTTESTLKAHIEKLMCASLRAVSIPMKRKPDGAMLSMGYGFAEFRTLESATAALKVLAGSVLEGHALEVKPSDKRISVASNNKRPLSGGKAGDNKNTKIIVRNVAFQASVEELKSLFSSFGAVKRVRIPKKLGGVHRGFAFVDFASSQEASSAMDALSSTHLYGRHLVLEWAKEDEEGDLEVEQLRKKARVDVKTAIKVSGGSTGGKGAVSVDKVLEEQMDRNVLSEDPPSDAED